MVKSTQIFLIFLVILAAANAQRPEPKLIDEFEDGPCEQLRGRLDLFLAELSNSIESKGVVVMYEGKYHHYGARGKTFVRPVFGEVNGRVNLFRSHFSFRGFDPTRITFVSGGFQENYRVELWMSPLGADLPSPKPTLRKMNYRKGNPTEVFCP